MEKFKTDNLEEDIIRRINTFLEIFDDENLLSKDAIKWLISNKFFEQSCSTKYHLSYKGGLFDHSLHVVSNLVELTTNMNLEWERPESPIIVGMFHDLCKIDAYKYDPIMKKFVWNTDQTDKGHGDKSIRYIEEHLFKLTEEEKACIRWHMGSFDEKYNWSGYTDSIKKYRNVLFTHTADMMATYIDEV